MSIVDEWPDYYDQINDPSEHDHVTISQEIHLEGNGHGDLFLFKCVWYLGTEQHIFTNMITLNTIAQMDAKQFAAIRELSVTGLLGVLQRKAEELNLPAPSSAGVVLGAAIPSVVKEEL